LGQSLGSQIRRLKTSFALSFALDEIMGKPIGFPHKNPRKKKQEKTECNHPKKGRDRLTNVRLGSIIIHP